jgi:hypothetical protein
VAAAIGFGFMAAACDDTDTPVHPGGVLPQIVSISPSPIQASSSPQTITVSGNQFVSGLRLHVAAPDGTVATAQGDDIQAVQATSFQAAVVLNQPGTYGFVVENDSGGQSNTFAAVVQTSATALPTIASVIPSSLPRTTSATVVALQGSNFGPGVTVTVTDPSGTTAVLGAASIGLQTATRVEFSFVFDAGGIYTVTVRNSGGDVSNPATITVN